MQPFAPQLIGDDASSDGQASVHASSYPSASAPADVPIGGRPPYESSPFLTNSSLKGQGGSQTQTWCLSTTPKTPDSCAQRIPRPANAFMLFRSDFLKKGIIPANVERKQQTLSKLAGKIWEGMSEEEKGEWRDLAEEVKSRHRKIYPNYKFTPMRGISRPKTKGHPVDGQPTDQNEEQWVEELHQRFFNTDVSKPPSPAHHRKGRSPRNVQLKPIVTPKVEPLASPLLSSISPSPPSSTFTHPSPYVPSSTFIHLPTPIPRRPSSAPGFRPSSGPMSSNNIFPIPPNLGVSPHVSQCPTDILPPRRPSTALGIRFFQDACTTDAVRSDIRRPISYDPIYSVPIAWHNPFSTDVSSLSRGVESLGLRNTGLPFGPLQISPLDVLPPFLTYPPSCAFDNTGNSYTFSNLSTTPDTTVEVIAQQSNVNYVVGPSHAETAFNTMQPSLPDNDGQSFTNYPVLPFGCPEVTKGPLESDFSLQYPNLR